MYNKVEEDVKLRLRNYNARQRHQKQKDSEKKEPQPYGIIRFSNGNVVMPRTKARYDLISNEHIWQIQFRQVCK